MNPDEDWARCSKSEEVSAGLKLPQHRASAVVAKRGACRATCCPIVQQRHCSRTLHDCSGCALSTSCACLVHL